jgi:hypothetical protein
MGRVYLTQTELAVRAVREARPDMTASDALAAVNMVRQSQLVCVSLMSPSGQSETSRDPAQVVCLREISGRRKSAFAGLADSGQPISAFRGKADAFESARFRLQLASSGLRVSQADGHNRSWLQYAISHQPGSWTGGR